MRLQKFLPNPVLLNVMAFFMAFCSICYEILIASRLSRLLGEGLFIYPAVIAIFILFMGLGSGGWFRKTSLPDEKTLRWLPRIELGLTVTGFFSILSINLLLYDSIYSVNTEALALGLLLAALIGFLSGQELPLLFHFCAVLHGDQRQIRQIILFDYLASFAASVLCTALFFPRLGFLKTSILIATLNLVLTLMVIYIQYANRLTYSRRLLFITVVLAGIFLNTTLHIDLIENRIIKRVFVGDRNAVLLEKRYTPYQQVLLFIARKDEMPITEPRALMLARPKDYYLFALLNGSLQFFEPFELKSDPDHTYLFDPYIALRPGIENILILGGGDGLPARQAVSYPGIKKITMVDLDREWVEFARTNPFMRKKNRRALEDPRISIHYMDAFKWVLSDREQHDLIVVDFPSEPASLAKIRTTSVQFFRDLRRRLSGQGIIVMHSNGRSLPLKLRILARTAREAGLFPLVGFHHGQEDRWSPVEQIVLFQSQQDRGTFLKKYNAEYPSYLKIKRKNEGYQFWSLAYSVPEEAGAWMSFYDPLMSRLPLRERLEILWKDHVNP